MGRVRTRLRALLHRRPRAQIVPIAQRFAEFRSIGAANNAFLESLARLTERADGSVRGLGAVSSLYEAMSSPVATMVSSMMQMAGGRYESLKRRYEEIDREVAQQVLKGRPIEYGALIMWPDGGAPLRDEEVGPKSARLAEVRRETGFAVPPFFVVSIYAYRLFMGATGLQDVVNEALWSLDLSDRDAVAAACERVRSAIATAEVPLALLTAMHEAFARLAAREPSSYGAAVRSSAVVEDSLVSFAGQFESVLNVSAVGLSAAYRQVIASKYRPETIEYATVSGFLEEDVAMPVLVMRMVQPMASGVAYSQDPDHPDVAVISAVRGLAEPLVAGRVTPERIVVARAGRSVVARTPGVATTALVCAPGGGTVERGAEGESSAALDDHQVDLVAAAAFELERHFGGPQDVEWALATDGRLFVVQTRPVRSASVVVPEPRRTAPIPGYRILVGGGVRASGGIACGPVSRAAGPLERGELPRGAVLVVPNLDPRLVQMIGHVSAIVAASGSPTGHMSTIAREFGLPTIVGAGDETSRLAEGALVTVDAWNGTVYEGRVPELLDGVLEGDAASRRRDPVLETLQALVERVAPLTLTDPTSRDFRPRNCRTLHDVARFVHQRAMEEMFTIETLPAKERRQSHRLAWDMPMDVRVLDLGGGVGATHGRSVALSDLTSVPLLALFEGMTDPRLRWSGPVGFDLRGFMSVVVRSAADDQRYGEPAYALCSRDYAHFASRLAYHFATADALCGPLVNENYARFLFHGGAAVSQRREWRAHFLATVLGYNGFVVRRSGDRVEAVLGKRAAEEIEESLVMLGRLMVASRHLDMVMGSQAAADLFARAFLSGDFGFDSVRRESG